MTAAELETLQKRVVAASFSAVGVLETGGGTSWPDCYEQDVTALLGLTNREAERLERWRAVIRACIRSVQLGNVGPASRELEKLLGES